MYLYGNRRIRSRLYRGRLLLYWYPIRSLSLFLLLFCSMASSVSAARAVHAANTKWLTDALFQVKLARAACKASGDIVAREVGKEQKDKIANVKPKVVVGKKQPKVKGAVCKVIAKSIRGRPSSGECNQCRRVLMGLKGGKAHTCGRIPYNRH